mmetsp:Transcript_36486/g.85615  ORF Transcript_36486/g.85615 Transcript_36486/m.85615 type:complete len:338 (-) Transcript_36486:3111-4124(-)
MGGERLRTVGSRAHEGGRLPRCLILLEGDLFAVRGDALGGRGRDLGAGEGGGDVSDPAARGALWRGGAHAQGLDTGGEGGGGGWGLGVGDSGGGTPLGNSRGGEGGGDRRVCLLAHPGVCVHLSVQEHELPPQHHPRHLARDLPALKRRPPALRVPIRQRGEGPLAVQVHLNMRVVLLREVEDQDWVGVQPKNKVFDGEASLRHGGEKQRQHGLEAGEAWGGRVCGLLRQSVRRVVRGEDVNDRHVVPQGLHILPLGQWGVHGAPATEPLSVLVAHEQVVGGDAARDLGATPLGLFDHHNLLPAAQRAHVDSAVVQHRHHQHSSQRLALRADHYGQL